MGLDCAGLRWRWVVIKTKEGELRNGDANARNVIDVPRSVHPSICPSVRPTDRPSDRERAPLRVRAQRNFVGSAAAARKAELHFRAERWPRRGRLTDSLTDPLTDGLTDMRRTAEIGGSGFLRSVPHSWLVGKNNAGKKSVLVYAGRNFNGLLWSSPKLTPKIPWEIHATNET